jgi:hypothetical protein
MLYYKVVGSLWRVTKHLHGVQDTAVWFHFVLLETSNQTDTGRINQVERKLNSDVTRFFYLFLLPLKSIGQMSWSTATAIDRR